MQPPQLESIVPNHLRNCTAIVTCSPGILGTVDMLERCRAVSCNNLTALEGLQPAVHGSAKSCIHIHTGSGVYDMT